MPSATSSVALSAFRTAGNSDSSPMAWDFAMNFAKDNGLQMAEACLIPDVPLK